MPQLATERDTNDRAAMLAELLALVKPVPTEWLVREQRHQRIEPARCTSWAEVEASWAKSQRWRQTHGDVLSIMLAIVASTSQTGNQLCMLIVADAGSMKSTLCDSLLVSKKCIPVEGITGLVSGAKSDDGRDLSFMARANHLTWITSEGDVLVKSPDFPTIMSQVRRAYDGRLDWVFKTTDEDKNFTGLRMPWMVAGTPRMLDSWDQSELGDRFLRVVLEQPENTERRAIVLHAIDNEWEAVAEHSNGTSGGVETKLHKVYALTGGYVDWLRDNAGKIDRVTAGSHVRHEVADLAEFVADMRAKPNTDPRKTDTHDGKELPTRIGRQLVRLARCLAFVLNKSEVDADVVRRVRKVALDSSKSKTLDMLGLFLRTNHYTGRTYQEGGGVTLGQLTKWAGFESEARCLAHLNFLLKIGVVEHAAQSDSYGHWRMTGRVAALYEGVRGA